jgi:hypothetical protein
MMTRGRARSLHAGWVGHPKEKKRILKVHKKWMKVTPCTRPEGAPGFRDDFYSTAQMKAKDPFRPNKG